MRGGLAALILIALVLFPFGGVHMHVTPPAAAADISSSHAVSHTQDHAHEHGNEHGDEAHGSTGSADTECCMAHCMPIDSLKHEIMVHARFDACFAAGPMAALCSNLVEKPLKPPRKKLS
ncbi:hypothetical protein [Nitratireductor aquibiodomus]|uniref:hypothetical protein n=2 Tax=Nitratireductor aquibiodomus TaxID=204799 RepID=UPI0012FD8F5D|nr:hypothetical protein [Nitratireductor aquibiodomus]